MIALVGVTMLLIGWWIPDFVRQVLSYGAENPDAAWLPSNVWMPAGFAWLALSVVLFGVGLYRLWRERTFPWLAMIGALNLNLLLTPHIVEYDLTMLLIPLFWVGNQWRSSRAGFAVWFLLMWFPWLSWAGVTMSGGKIDDWWKAIWLTYPLLLVVAVLIQFAWGRLRNKELWILQRA